jgi:sugar lactone lactonase YvrE
MLVLLLALLALLAYVTFFFVQNRRMPGIKIATTQAAVNPPQYLYSITGAGANELDRPAGVAVGPDGRVYTVDFGKRRISVFTNAGRFLTSFNKTDVGTLHSPVHLAIRGEELFVSDRRDRAIYIYDLNGTFKRRFAAKNEPSLDWGPMAMSFDATGALRVTDIGNSNLHRIEYFSADGSRTATVGRTVQVVGAQESPLGFYFPDGISVSRDGRVFVSDGNNRRVQVLGPTGEFKYFIDTQGIPRGMVIDAKQRLYIVDALAHSVDVRSLDGKLLTQFGSQGFGPGQFNYPNDVTLDARGRIYVSDRENDQIQVWGWPVAEPPAIGVPKSAWGWALCLLPLLLLFLPLAFRRVHVLVTPDFVEALVAGEQIAAVAGSRRLRLISPEEDHHLYEGRVVEEVDLGELIASEVFSESDVRAVKDRLECDQRTAVVLSMASRTKALATTDAELRRLAVLVEVPTVDLQEFLAEFVSRSGRNQS